MTIAAVVAGFAIGYFVRRILAEAKIGSAEQAARKIVEEAEKEAEAARREILLEAKEEAHRLRTEIEQESRARRGELQRSERRLFQKEESLDRKAEALERREEAINRKERELDGLKKDLEHVYEQQRAELERLSGLSSDEARELLLKNIEEEIRHEAAIMIRDIEARTKEEADRKAREIIATAIQRYAADHVAEISVSVVTLPNDEMKGRIIGREGRNIRTIETLTGVDLIIDDTPEAVILSAFDPVRREVAKIALEKLINDGRIHLRESKRWWRKHKRS